MSGNLRPGFVTLHGNQLEQLRDAVFEWVHANPLGPLEQEIFLVQSNGVAEWLKIALADTTGVCAATRIMLPARFLWEAYRNLLGPDQVPADSPFDRSALVWRLMCLLPTIIQEPGFEPLRHFLADADAERRLQLATRLADLLDQYQVYRADWLADWETDRNVLAHPQRAPMPLPADQDWQAQLWRTIVASVPPEERGSGRAEVHRRFIEALRRNISPAARLPRRLVLFGVSTLPAQTLEALSALSSRTQVLLAVLNPCQFYWGDVIQGRDLLTAARRRQQLRNGKDLSVVPDEDLYRHSHPLLATWGKQGRDFVRMLDEFDDAQATRQHFPALRVDLFSEGDGHTLLEQTQAAIRDLLPLDDHVYGAVARDDRSIQFHIAHSAQREVEVLHDQLLHLFAHAATSPLRPRDVVVMMPDIEQFCPAIQAVFGQYPRTDPRHIPFEIADVGQRRANPLLVSLDWLLRLPRQRCLQSEVRDLLDVPAIAARFGISEADLPLLSQWIEGSGVRWGLDQNHREALGLGPAGEQNAWIFGIRRMLLGYASGDNACFGDIEPYAEIGGLDAALAGSLAVFVEALLAWRALLAEPVPPAVWGGRARSLMQTFFDARDEHDRLLCAQLEQALERWLEHCERACFDEPVPVDVLREAWLGAIDETSLNQRFVSGGVTFCTLMPMRAVPFRVVCLLGMNEGDFPRHTSRADFDLLAQPGVARPGDRSRRDDDRYLMLEALLAARETLYISWVGRSARDNSEQPPSLLVSQLRDYLARGWKLDLTQLTTEHPLQPFSRRYFEGGALFTYAREWRIAHAEADKDSAALPANSAVEPDVRLRLDDLKNFLRQPVKYFFRRRLQVVFAENRVVGEDDEPFGLDPLQKHSVCETLLDEDGAPESIDEVPQRLRQRAARLAREGILPIGHLGVLWQEQLVHELTPIRTTWLALCQKFPQPAEKVAVDLEHAGVRVEDWLDHLRSNGDEVAWLTYNPGKVTTTIQKVPVPRGHKLIGAWLRQLAAAAAGRPVTGYLVARDALLRMSPIEQDAACGILDTLLDCWLDGMQRPLPTACKTALQLIDDGDARSAYDGDFNTEGEVKEPCLARLWPDFDALSAEPDWVTCSTALYGPLAQWLHTHVAILPLEGEPEKEAA